VGVCYRPAEGGEMKLHIVLSVKFRAFGVTFGNISEQWDKALPFTSIVPAQNLLTYSERGVTLTISLLAQ
jgi:hypothetical protein